MAIQARSIVMHVMRIFFFGIAKRGLMAFSTDRLHSADQSKGRCPGLSGMTEFTFAAFERRMLIGHEEMIVRGRMSVMTGDTIGLTQVISLMGGGKSLILIMAAKTEFGDIVGQQSVMGRSVRSMA